MFLQRIMTIDEIWEHDLKPELKSQSEVWKEKIHRVAKILTPSFEGEANDDNGLQLYLCNCHIRGAIWLYSEPTCVHTLPS